MSGGRGESGSALTPPRPRPRPSGCDGEDDDMLTCGMLKNERHSKWTDELMTIVDD